MLAGCSLLNANAPHPRYFQVEFPRIGFAAPVPGQVSDVTATILSVEVSPPIGGLGDTFVAAVAGRPNAVVVGWVGGACDARNDLNLSPGGDGRPTFTLKLLGGREACDAVGVQRRLILTFDHVVSAANFRLEVVR